MKRIIKLPATFDDYLTQALYRGIGKITDYRNEIEGLLYEGPSVSPEDLRTIRQHLLLIEVTLAEILRETRVMRQALS